MPYILPNNTNYRGIYSEQNKKKNKKKRSKSKKDRVTKKTIHGRGNISCFFFNIYKIYFLLFRTCFFFVC